MRSDVVALYVDPRGPYPGLVAEWYDETRDARTYAGPLPVVAHPPCGPWSSLSHLSERPQDKELFAWALDQVRRWGGVLEHPAHSRAFRAHGINPTMQVDQCDWGHPARKSTWLYMVPADLPPGPQPIKRSPTHWCSGGGTGRGRTPPGIKVCSAQQRRRTPPAFAEFLLEMASKARPS